MTTDTFRKLEWGFWDHLLAFLSAIMLTKPSQGMWLAKSVYKHALTNSHELVKRIQLIKQTYLMPHLHDGFRFAEVQGEMHIYWQCQDSETKISLLCDDIGWYITVHGQPQCVRARITAAPKQNLRLKKRILHA